MTDRRVGARDRNWLITSDGSTSLHGASTFKTSVALAGTVGVGVESSATTSMAADDTTMATRIRAMTRPAPRRRDKQTPRRQYSAPEARRHDGAANLHRRLDDPHRLVLASSMPSAASRAWSRLINSCLTSA